MAATVSCSSHVLQTCHSPRPAGRLSCSKFQRHAHGMLPQPALLDSKRTCLPTWLTRASDTDEDLVSTATMEPEDVRGAIAVGLELYEAGKYPESLEVFEKALKLPGTGMKRYRDKPRLISDGEKQSVLYNVACCYSRMGDARTGLVALAGCLESGYTDVQQMRTDPDLEFLRKDPKFEGLIERFKLASRKGFLNQFLQGFNL